MALVAIRGSEDKASNFESLGFELLEMDCAAGRLVEHLPNQTPRPDLPAQSSYTFDLPIERFPILPS